MSNKRLIFSRKLISLSNLKIDKNRYVEIEPQREVPSKLV